MTRPDIALKLVGDINQAAQRGEADAFVTDCPMCQANLESRQLELETEKRMPVYFVTELIEAALTGHYPKKQEKLHLLPAELMLSVMEPDQPEQEVQK